MIAFWLLLVGVALGLIIGRVQSRRVPSSPVVLFDTDEFASKYRNRRDDLRARLHRMRSS